MMMQRSIAKLFNCSLIKLKANMQSTKALERKTKLSKIVIDRILMSRPSICAAIVLFRLIACVIVVSSCEPYLRIDTPKIRNEIPVKVRTHLSKVSLLPPALMSSLSIKLKSQSQYLVIESIRDLHLAKQTM